MGSVAARLGRLEGAAFDALVRRLAAEHGLSGQAQAEAIAETRRVFARVARLRAQGLSGREALRVCAIDAGLDAGAVDAVLDQLEEGP